MSVVYDITSKESFQDIIIIAYERNVLLLSSFILLSGSIGNMVISSSVETGASSVMNCLD